jgi:hypothetical protein
MRTLGAPATGTRLACPAPPGSHGPPSFVAGFGFLGHYGFSESPRVQAARHTAAAYIGSRGKHEAGRE